VPKMARGEAYKEEGQRKLDRGSEVGTDSSQRTGQGRASSSEET